MAIPRFGAVLGVDVGYSVKRRSSAICRLEWDENQLDWEFRRFRCDAAERQCAIAEMTGLRQILAAAFDGPFCADLENAIGEYRCAESILTREIGRIIGKPGPSNSPVGRKLNCATNGIVKDVLTQGRLARACHDRAVHEFAAVEAFPSSYMGLLLADGRKLNGSRAGKSDRYFAELVRTNVFEALLERFIPRRQPEKGLEEITNHDERAAFVCALTAVGIVANDFTAVGDVKHGWIILPPKDLIQADLLATLLRNAGKETQPAILFASPIA
jgi:predicted RNase H-like nuclease